MRSQVLDNRQEVTWSEIELTSTGLLKLGYDDVYINLEANMYRDSDTATNIVLSFRLNKYLLRLKGLLKYLKQ